MASHMRRCRRLASHSGPSVNRARAACGSLRLLALCVPCSTPSLHCLSPCDPQVAALKRELWRLQARAARAALRSAAGRRAAPRAAARKARAVELAARAAAARLALLAAGVEAAAAG